MNAPVGLLRPAGMPAGMDPREWRKAIEARLNELLDQSFALISALDCMEADCDLEDNADAEAWLGWTDRGPGSGGHAFYFDGKAHDDLELDDADAEDGHDAELDQTDRATAQWSERTDIPQKGPNWHSTALAERSLAQASPAMIGRNLRQTVPSIRPIWRQT